eukprot:gene19829-26516_t
MLNSSVFSSNREKLDFDDEAHKLFKTLNLKAGEVGGDYNYLDVVWRHPTSGGRLYIGNQTAAQDRNVQGAHGITHIVNCTADMPNYHEGAEGLSYYRFDVSSHWRHMDATEESVTRFVEPMFTFVDKALEKGDGVLIHCLAGANREQESVTRFVEPMFRFVDKALEKGDGVLIHCLAENKEGGESHRNAASISGEAPAVSSLTTLPGHWELLLIPSSIDADEDQDEDGGGADGYSDAGGKLIP